ncbi:Signal recognition particle 9 [Carabus blaptoides fortunei]
MKYVHSKNVVILKVTDDIVCLQFRTEIAQDLRKIDKFVSNLMRHMVSKEH